MYFGGNHIVIKLKSGEVKDFRGSAYTLQIESHSTYHWVNVFLNGQHHYDVDGTHVELINEGGYSKEYLS